MWLRYCLEYDPYVSKKGRTKHNIANRNLLLLFMLVVSRHRRTTRRSIDCPSWVRLMRSGSLRSTNMTIVVGPVVQTPAGSRQ